MPTDNAVNVARQANAESRVQQAVDALRDRGQPLGLRAIAREANASLATVRKLQQLWQDTAEAGSGACPADPDIEPAPWHARLAAFQPATIEAYLQSVWPAPITADTIARWYAEMTQLRRLYGSRQIRVAPTTYRMFADWMNTVLDDVQHHSNLQDIESAVARWQGNPVEALLTDGALAGIALPRSMQEVLRRLTPATESGDKPVQPSPTEEHFQ
jgi:hypothetical protein